MKRYSLLFSIALISFIAVQNCQAQTFQSGDNDKPLNKSKIEFIENLGQISDNQGKARPEIKFSCNTNGVFFNFKNDGYSFYLSKPIESEITDNKTDLLSQKSVEVRDLATHRIDIAWKGANPEPEIIADEVLPGYLNYYLPACPKGVTKVRSYKSIRFMELYKNIDLKWYNKNGNLEYDYIVSPGADPSQIKWEIQGATNLYLSEDGQLIIETSLGIIKESAPIAFQGSRKVQVHWKVENKTVSFDVADFDKSKQLIIDPVIRLWATYYGGNSLERAESVSTDENSNVYIGGYTGSNTNIASVGSFKDTITGFQDAFLVKFNSDGQRLWATYYGGTNRDYAMDCFADKNDFVYLFGYTTSTNLPTTSGVHQQTNNGDSDNFLIKFSNDGSQVWATYFGGSKGEAGFSCAADASGNVYICGITDSKSDIASSGAHQTTLAGIGLFDGFIAKFDNAGKRLWSTYYGGDGKDWGRDIRVDGQSNIIFSGITDSQNNISSSGSHQEINSGAEDAFLVKFNSLGTRLWATYYGGSDSDNGNGLGIDNMNNIYLSGTSYSNSGIATPGAHRTIGKNGDAFLVKFDENGVRQWGTYFGEKGQDRGLDCSVDPFSNIYLLGITKSSNGIATSGSFQSIIGGLWDSFIARFSSDGSLLVASYFGGPEDDMGLACAVDNSNVYIAGITESIIGIPSSGAHQEPFGGGKADAFLVKMRQNPVGIEKNYVQPSSFTLIPNPSSGKFLIKTTKNVEGQLQVYNSLGSLVYSGIIKDESSMEITLPSYLNEGVYFVRLIQEESISTQKLILKMNQ